MKKEQSKATIFLDNKYIPLDKKFKLLIGASLLLIPVVIFYFAYYQKTVQQLATLHTEQETLQKAINKAKIMAANLDKVEGQKKKADELFAEMAKFLPTEQEIPSLLTNISALGRSAGLDFLSFRPGQETAKDFYSEIPVSISISGPYHNMGLFLDQVSKLNRIVSVTNIRMSSPRKGAGHMILTSSCNLATYRFTGIGLAPPKTN